MGKVPGFCSADSRGSRAAPGWELAPHAEPGAQGLPGHVSTEQCEHQVHTHLLHPRAPGRAAPWNEPQATHVPWMPHPAPPYCWVKLALCCEGCLTVSVNTNQKLTGGTCSCSGGWRCTGTVRVLFLPHPWRPHPLSWPQARGHLPEGALSHTHAWPLLPGRNLGALLSPPAPHTYFIPIKRNGRKLLITHRPHTSSVSPVSALLWFLLVMAVIATWGWPHPDSASQGPLQAGPYSRTDRQTDGSSLP